jgi:hypothetical protein
VSLGEHFAEQGQHGGVREMKQHGANQTAASGSTVGTNPAICNPSAAVHAHCLGRRRRSVTNADALTMSVDTERETLPNSVARRLPEYC